MNEAVTHLVVAILGNSCFAVLEELEFASSATPRKLHCKFRQLLSLITRIWIVRLHSSHGVEELRSGRTPGHALNFHVLHDGACDIDDDALFEL